MYDIDLGRFLGKKIIGINEIYPILIFEVEGFLTIECSWRLRDKKTILVGSSEYNSEESHKKAHDKLLNLLKDKEIKSIKIIPPVSDLRVDFENGLSLELFSDSNIYESWTLSDGKNFELISATAGQCCSFDK
jgi:hypothetical protein